MSSSFKRKGPGLGLLIERIRKPGTVDVGIIDAGVHDETELTVASIGFIHEFGGGNSPERSFIRSTTTEKKKEIIAFQKKLMRKIVAGVLTTDKALGLLGEFVADLITQKIVDISDPPNHPSTIAKKGSSNPLIATSQLKNSITYEVNK